MSKRPEQEMIAHKLLVEQIGKDAAYVSLLEDSLERASKLGSMMEELTFTTSASGHMKATAYLVEYEEPEEWR
jgi:hypothetical protein